MEGGNTTESAYDTNLEFPTSFMNTLKSLIPAHFPLDLLEVVSSSEPIVCLRFSASKSLYATDALADKLSLEASDMILLSSAVARESADGKSERNASIFR